MKNKCLIEVGDARINRMTGDLVFTTVLNEDAIEMLKDISYNENATPEQLANEAAKILHQAIYLSYHRGGKRRLHK